MTLELVISDLDGTILETEDYHRLAYNHLFKELSLEVSWSKQDYINRLNVMGGGKLREVFSWLNKQENQYEKFRYEAYEKKTQLYLDLITKDLRNGSLELRTGVARLFEEIQASCIPLAIGTACEKKAAFTVLEAALGPDFCSNLATLCGGDDVLKKKPDPAIYLLVAQRCQVDPSNCLVLEDTRHGMEAALAAGMKCIVTPSEYAKEHDFNGATLHAIDLETPCRIGLKELLCLFT